MKLAVNFHANAWITAITLLLLGCSSVCGYASNAHKSKWGNLTTTRARVDYLEDSKRIEAKQPDRVLDILGVKQGDVVADVGCGTGVFTFRMADRVGKGGKVYAVDVLDDMLAYVGTKMKKAGVTNITLVKSSESDPHLPTGSCDKILLIDTYQHIGNKSSFFGKLRNSLKKNGTIAVISVSFAKEMPGQTVIQETENLGFRFNEKYDFLGIRYFLVFSRT